MREKGTDACDLVTVREQGFAGIILIREDEPLQNFITQGLAISRYFLVPILSQVCPLFVLGRKTARWFIPYLL